MQTKLLWIGILVTISFVSTAWAQTTIDFNQEKPGVLPAHFKATLTGKGKPGEWKVIEEPEKASKPGDKRHVLAQLHSDRTSYRFPVCVYQKFSAKNLDIRVQFKPITGRVDRAAGLVWRYQDRNNYYIVRANALEHNVVLYKIHRGIRKDLPLLGRGRTYGAKAAVPTNRWSTLRVVVKNHLFTVYLNQKKLYQVLDKTFTQPGKIGLWTKADSVTYFRRLQFQALP